MFSKVFLCTVLVRLLFFPFCCDVILLLYDTLYHFIIYQHFEFSASGHCDIVDGMATSKYFIVYGMMVFMVIVLIEFYSNYLVICSLNTSVELQIVSFWMTILS